MTDLGRSAYELFAPVTLQIEERGQVAMIDADRRRFLHSRLGVECDTQARILEHRDVIGAIAHGERVDEAEAEAFRQLMQGKNLGILSEDRLAYGAPARDFFTEMLSVVR